MVVQCKGRGILYWQGPCSHQNDPRSFWPWSALDLQHEWEVNACCANSWVWGLWQPLIWTENQLCQGKYISTPPQTGLLGPCSQIVWGIYRTCQMGYCGWVESPHWQERKFSLALLLSLFWMILSRDAVTLKELVDPGQRNLDTDQS